MGLLDALLGNDSDGSGMLGGLPQSWQYQNPVDLTPAQKRMMAMVGTQNPQDAGFNPLPQSMSPSTIFANGTAPITGGNTFGLGGMQPQQPAAPPQQPAAWPPAASPIAGLNNPFGQAPPQGAPIVAASDDDDEPAPGAQASPIGVGNYQMPRIGSAADFAPNPAAIPANAQPAQGQLPTAPAAAPAASPSIGDHLLSGLQSFAASKGILPALVNGIGGLATGQRTDPEGVATRQQSQVANVTARALISRGVDPQTAIAAVQPGNGEMLKTLIESAFKPKDPMNLGSGYVLRPGAAKAERLFTPDDKTPAGFTQADDGTMRFTPGGPADPAYLRLAEAQKKDPKANFVLGRGGEIVKNNDDGSVTVIHKNETEAPVPMDPASLEILARREIGGDFSGRKNLGRGAQGAADLKAITNKSSEILTNEMGMTATQAADHLLKKQQEFNAQGQGLNAEARTTGVREANLNLILKAADAAIPAALEASDKVARTGWVPLNSIIQHGEVMTSDPDLKKFGMANLQLAEHWARAMNPTGVLRESDRDKALSYLSTADSKETYKAAVGQLRTQIERERDAVKATRGMSDLPGAGGTSTPGASPSLAVGQSTVINGVPITKVKD